MMAVGDWLYSLSLVNDFSFCELGWGDTTLKLTSFSMALSDKQPHQPSISPTARPILADRE